jgi:2-methylisocitrate lyase-like PEP mutase family enzyme
MSGNELSTEAPRSVEEIALIGREITAPKLINIVAGGLTPQLDPAALGELGYAVAIYPTTAEVLRLQVLLFEAV